MTSRNYSVEQSNVDYKINEILFTKSLSSETKCNQKVIIAIKVIKAGLRKLKYVCGGIAIYIHLSLLRLHVQHTITIYTKADNYDPTINIYDDTSLFTILFTRF